MKLGWDTYTPTEETRNDIYAAPLKAEAAQLAGLPPTVILIHDWMLLNPIQSVPSVQASFRHAAAELTHRLG